MFYPIPHTYLDIILLCAMFVYINVFSIFVYDYISSSQVFHLVLFLFLSAWGMFFIF